MKINKILFGALLAAGMVSACQKADLYDVKEPEWVQEKIDSIASEKAKANSGDTVSIDIAAVTVGATDNSAGWWTEFSDYFEIPAGKKLTLEFVNFSSGANNWSNWNLAAVNKKRDTDGYGEYFVIRSDNYGWGGSLENGYDAALLSVDYFEEGKAADWESWLSKMNGAQVKMEIDHASAGPTYVTVEQTGTDGVVYTENFVSEGTTGESILVFLVCDGSHFDMKKAYLTPSEITVIEDQMPQSLTVTDYPSALEIGETDFWKDAKATVTFADGTSKAVDTADVTFTLIPDLSTVGEKTVVVSYSKSKQGKYCQAVATSYKLEVTNAIKSISAKYTGNDRTFYYFDADFALSADMFELTASYSDGTTGSLESRNAAFTLRASDGKVTAAYGSFTAEAVNIKTSKGTSAAGTPDRTTHWSATPFGTVEAGKSKTVKVMMYGEVNDWDCALAEITSANGNWTYCINANQWGFGDNNQLSTSVDKQEFFIEGVYSNDDRKADLIKGIDCAITFTNNGDGTATVKYEGVTSDGQKRELVFTTIGLPETFDCDITMDGAYLVFHE